MVTFDSIKSYYDNRKCVVTSTHDDFMTGGFVEGMNLFRSYKVWFGCGVIVCSLSDTTWQILIDQVNSGYVEVCNHSWSHGHIPYPNPDEEVNFSSDMLLSKLSLPFGQYIYVWIQPYSEYDDIVRALLSARKYLFDGMGGVVGTPQACNLAPFVPADNMFQRKDFCIAMGGESGGITDVNVLNAKYDSVYNAGGVYHVRTHPAVTDWAVGHYADLHLSHISGHKDVWYAPLGCLYLTQYAIAKSIITAQTVPYPPSSGTSYMLPVKTTDDEFNGIEYIRQVGSVLYVGIHFLGTREVHLKFYESGQVIRVTIPQDEWQNYGFQYPLTLKFTGVSANETVRKYIAPVTVPPITKSVNDIGKTWGFRYWKMQDKVWC
jgi:hypothetical protein